MVAWYHVCPSPPPAATRSNDLANDRKLVAAILEKDRIYVTNTGDNSIEVYSLADPLNPAPIQHFVTAPNQRRSGFFAEDGTLTEPFAPTALPVTSTPPVRVQGIAVH
jgi:hypothetical protein